uniref:Uncharacterized protein n=1 Tax=Davidia involucrata TaxID=16924 RepID=A0A5B7BPZ6_DAVIN
MKNKLLLCFRPVVLKAEIESKGLDNCSDGGVCTYLSFSNKENLKISTINSSPSDNERFGISEESIRRRRESNSHWKFSRVLRAVLFGISLRKRVRDRNVRRLEFRSKSDSFLDLSDDKSVNPKSLEAKLKNFRSLSSKKCLSRSQSNFFDQKKQSTNNPQNPSEVKTKNRVIAGLSSNPGLCLVLITLFVTILWGRVFAILFTSVWLYFLPGRINFDRPSENMAKASPETESSRDYKKRVIMEGLLGRNHHQRDALNF